MRWPKYWSFSFSISPYKENPGVISFRMDWLDLLAVQETLKSLLQHHSSKASVLWCSAFFTVLISHPYVTTGKTIALTRWTFFGKIMSLLFNILSRLIITFLQDLLELTPQKDVLFIIGDWNAKVRSQETPGVTGKFGLGTWNEAGQRLIESCQENVLVTTNTLFQQHKRRLYTWTSTDGQHWIQTDYILCSQRWRSCIQWGKTRPGADCGSNHELLIAKFRHQLKKVGKTSRPFRYDLNQIPYGYTVEVRNGSKGLDMIDRLPDEQWTEVHDIAQ